MRLRNRVSATLFVVALTLSTVLGAIPVVVSTPAGTVSLAAPVAEARARNTQANRLQNLRVRTSQVNFQESFSATRHTYNIYQRQDIRRIEIQPTRRSGQSIRHRIDTRRPNGTWNNGNWSRWRTGSAANNRIGVSTDPGQHRRMRIAVRDSNGNVRTITVHIRRASGNTFATALNANVVNANGNIGASLTPTPRFARSTHDYTINLTNAQARVRLQMPREHHNAQIRSRVHNGSSWGSWNAWTRASNPARTVDVPAGGQRRVQFRIRGAWTHRVSSPLRERTYTITINRAAAPVQTPPTQPPPQTPPTQTPPAQPQVQTRTLTFNSQGGSAVASRTFIANQPFGALPTPTRTGFTFLGWFTAASGGTQITANSTHPQNLTVHAQWRGNISTDGQGWRRVTGQEWLRFNPGRAEFQMTATADWTEARALFNLINQHRVANGLQPFAFCQQAANVAMQRAAEASVYWSHTRPNGSGFETINQNFWSDGGENLSSGSNANAVFTAWRNSPGHNALMLQDFGSQTAGVGIVRGPDGLGRAALLTGFNPSSGQHPTGQSTVIYTIPFSMALYNSTPSNLWGGFGALASSGNISELVGRLIHNR